MSARPGRLVFQLARGAFLCHPRPPLGGDNGI
nr:MAG TPA: hypothetical protein [Caudoviricetes sp.]